ncbi:uncharacterized protein LOC119745070 [Patiria miniata]|uniref:F5/8 type C domain-containing protein n=1 Tax=Patiria miniata TaxID=46514 RepID=A0A914BMP9_PATMI|nr:uncharacterized protein LOC119745070 [Patiria miniata]
MDSIDIVDLGERTRVSGIIIQKPYYWHGCITSFHLEYAISDDVTKWIPILNSDRTEVFQVKAYFTQHQRERHISYFYSSVLARFIRLNEGLDNSPWHCFLMRFDFIGCRNHPRMTRTCQTLFSDGYVLDDTYQIDMDGIDQGQPPFQVTCSMSDGATIIHHDAEDTFKISGSPNQLTTIDITYVIDMQQIISVIDNASTCEQMVKVKCGEADPSTLSQHPALQPVKWGSRSGELMQNWGGPLVTLAAPVV